MAYGGAVASTLSQRPDYADGELELLTRESGRSAEVEMLGYQDNPGGTGRRYQILVTVKGGNDVPIFFDMRVQELVKGRRMPARQEGYEAYRVKGGLPLNYRNPSAPGVGGNTAPGMESNAEQPEGDPPEGGNLVLFGLPGGYVIAGAGALALGAFYLMRKG